MDGSNYNIGRDLDLSVQGDLVSGDKFTGDKIVNIQQIYQTLEQELIIARMAPSPPTLFVGRVELLFDLVVYLEEAADAETDNAAMLFLSGMAGVGKTAIATILAHDPVVEEHYPDGTLWAELGPNPDLMTWLATWGEQLGTDLTSYNTLEARSLALGTLVHHKKILFVFDDVWHAADVRPLLVASAQSQVLITTRDSQLSTLLGGKVSTHYRINPLTETEGLALIKELVPQAVEKEADTARELITHLGGLPLSIILAGQTVASESQAGFSVANALQELLDRGGSMGGKGGAGREVDSLRAMLSVSYDHLPDERVRQAFRSLAVFGARPRTFAIDAAAHVWKVDSRTAQKQMVTLVNQQMVEPLGEGVFALHNAFASFATTLLVEHTELEALQEAHIQYYLELAQTYATADWRQVEKNIDQIRQAFQLVRREGNYHLIVDYLMAMNSYFSRRGLWHELLQWTEIALAAVQSDGNQRLEGILYSNMGAIYQQQSELDRALSAYKHSSQLLEAADDQDGLAVVLNNMGAIYARLDLIEEAFDAYDQGQKILERSEDRAGQAALATMLNNIGTLYQRQEAWFEALEYYQLAYRFYEALQDHVGLANTLNHIGTIYSGQQRFEDALIQFERSQSLFNEAGDLVGESTSLYNMALIYEDLNRLEAAERAMGRLVEIEEQLNHPDLIEDRETLRRLRHMLGISVEENQVDQ